MRISVFISIIIASIGLQSCNSTVKSVYRDDFRSASKPEIEKVQKEVNAQNSNKSILFLTQVYKGEKIIITQKGKTIYSEYPITNLNNRIASYLSFNNQQDLVINDRNSKKEILIPSKKSSKHKYVYVMKKVTKGKFQFIITYSNTLRPMK
ncbi:hypothetical protein [Flavobacterium proteolyticum]|uniref:DUF4251 domain-containing protein n=1 Tax=Flavobacterium proteolyticum TaxID=2911683 RepID=A0ABR9WPW2_9FLAO|nr:hypothetical protein [Flavobacterium proteolyticum]MBE9575950.1 hypothetical protein [Flavobacterium proteolyticum]